MGALDAHVASLDLRPGGFRYYEPMCGGLTVGLHIMETYQPFEAHIADASPDIINFFVVLKNQYACLTERVRALAGTGIDEHGYYALRQRFNLKADCPVEAAAQFYLLNRACFNGVYRVNAAGHFNVPFGRFREGVCAVTPAMWSQLHRAHLILQKSRVHFECVDVESFLARTRVDSSGRLDLVYCDPPYIGTDPSLYHPRDCFDSAKHARLRELLDRWVRGGSRVMVNNSNCEAVRAVYAGWDISPMATVRSVSARVESRGEGCHELLLTSRLSAASLS